MIIAENSDLNKSLIIKYTTGTDKVEIKQPISRITEILSPKIYVQKCNNTKYKGTCKSSK